MGEPLKYRTDFDKHVVTCNFERRGWERWDPRYDDDWHVFWASVSTIKQIFAPENGIRLGDHQIVKHFPNHYELTRKDLMVKNITRWRKACEKEAALEANGAGQTNGNFNNTGMSATELLPKLDFVPVPFEAHWPLAPDVTGDVDEGDVAQDDVDEDGNGMDDGTVASSHGFALRPDLHGCDGFYVARWVRKPEPGWEPG